MIAASLFFLFHAILMGLLVAFAISSIIRSTEKFLCLRCVKAKTVMAEAIEADAIEVGGLKADAIEVGALKADSITASMGTFGSIQVSTGTFLVNPMTSVGDMIVGGVGGSTMRLPIGTAQQVLTSDGTSAMWTTVLPQATQQILTVTKDAPTIQGCIDLITDASPTKCYVVYIPPGQYTENLTLKGNVNLCGLNIPLDSEGVDIYGYHTFTATNSNALFNRMGLANLHMNNNSGNTNPVLRVVGVDAFSAEVLLSGCFMEQRNSSLATEVVTLEHTDSGAPGQRGSTMYITNCKTRMNTTAGSGGTHFTIRNGGSMYLNYDVDASNGTQAVNMTAGPRVFAYMQPTNCRFEINSPVGGSVAQLSAIGSTTTCTLASLGCYWTNLAASGGNGLNLLSTNCNFLSSGDVYTMPNTASTYVVTGVSGSTFYSSTANAYRNNDRIKNTVTQVTFPSTLVPPP